ncbi:beta strand repeat-containing protein [Paracoccus kondratievae]
MGDGGRISGDVTNAGTMEIAGRIDDRLSNSGTVGTRGDVSVGELVTGSGGDTTISAGDRLSSSRQVVNEGQTHIYGTLAGDLLNSAGTTELLGGRIEGDVVNDATLSAHGTITGSVENGGTLDLTGDLRVGSLTNAGTTDVGAGERLTVDQVLRNQDSGVLNVAGAVTVTGSDGIQNDGELTLDGAEVTGNVTNRGTMQVLSSSQINGNLTNRELLEMGGGGGDVTLTVDGTFSNSGTVTGSAAGNLTIVTDLFAVEEGGTVTNVDVIGDMENRSTVIYDRDSFLDGDLTNGAAGTVRISAQLDMRNHDVTNHGNFTVTNDADSNGNLANVAQLTNDGSFTVAADAQANAQAVSNLSGGQMTVAGTLNSAGAVQNAGQLTVSGQVNAGLENTGTTRLSGGAIAGAVTNDGQLRGNGTVTGSVTNNGTLAPDGTLIVGGLVNNEIVDIASGSILRSASEVQNNDRMTVSGLLDAGLSNAGTGHLTLNGGRISGAVGNAGTITGTGTLSGLLTNSGTATLGGRLMAGAENSGTLTSAGTLRTASLHNTGTVNVAAGSTLVSDSAVANENQLNVAGRLSADVANTGTVTLSGGTIAGAVTNDGRLQGDGTITGSLLNNDEARIGGRVGGTVTNNGTLTSSGRLSVAGLVNNELLNVAAGSTLASDSVVLNAGVISLSGRLDGSVETSGTGRLGLSGGVLDGSLTNGGLLSGTGRITGTVSNTGTVRADQDELRVGGLTNGGQVEIAAGGTLRSDSQVQNDRDLSIDGRLIGGCRTRRRATR